MSHPLNMSSPDSSNCETYSEDFSNEEGSADEDHSMHSAEILVADQFLSKKHANCSCPSEVKHPVAHHSSHEPASKCKHRSKQSKPANLKEFHVTDQERPVSDKDENSFSTGVASPQRRVRKFSEPMKQNNRCDTIRQRAKTQVLNPKTAKQKSLMKNNNKNTAAPVSAAATQQLLSARKIKIDHLRNQIIDLERRLLSEQKENKILKNLYNRQQKELSKVEESRVEIPELEKAHDEEIRVLKTLMRKVQEKNKELELKLRSKDEELQRRFTVIQNLKASLQEKKKIEAESEKRISALKMRVEKRDENIMMLKQNLSNYERKITDDRKSHEMTKSELRSLRKKYEELRKTPVEIKFLKQSAVLACDVPDDVSQKFLNSSVKNEIPKDKSQELSSSQVIGDQPSSQVLKESITHTVECRSENDQSFLSSLRKSQSKVGTSTRQSLLSSSASGTKVFKMQRSEAAKTLMKQSPSSESSGRMNAPMKPAYSEDLPMPLIIPSSAPEKSVTESDSSYTNSCSEECSGTCYKQSVTCNQQHVTSNQYKSHESYVAQSKIKHKRR